MNFKNTWLWLIVAASLSSFILFYQRHAHTGPEGPQKILPDLNVSAVTAVQVLPRGQLEIRAERTNDGWQLSKPLLYPAQSTSVENLLTTLEQLTPAAFITESELKNRFSADEEYGFADPQATVILEQGNYRPRLRIGIRTPPGDQVFLQVVGLPGAYVVDADLLKLVPHTINDWRDTALVNLESVAFDRITVTNGATAFELHRLATNAPWRMVYPIQARAGQAKIDEALQRLQNLRINQFVSDDAQEDLEARGLRPAELEIVLGRETNTVARLQFGRTVTNDARQVYARRAGQKALVTVSKDLLAPWRGSVNDFRDPYLVELTGPVEAISVRGEDDFHVLQESNNTWRIMPQNLPADSDLVKDLISVLGGLQIIEFSKDVVTARALPTFDGLATQARQYLLQSRTTNSPAGPTNVLLAELDFGTNQQNRVFARRGDENSIFAVKPDDFQRLPSASWQLRERKIWDFTGNDVARVTIRQAGRIRQLLRNGPHSWSLAPGSQGIINDLAVEETVRGLAQLAAASWVARGDSNRSRYGFSDDGLQIILELRSGEKGSVEFGGNASATVQYAAVKLDGEPWIFEFPMSLNQFVQSYLTIPANVN